MSRWSTAFIAFAVALAPLVAHGQLPTTRLNTISPAGGKIGSEIDVTITGTELDEVNRLIFSHAGVTATQKTSAATDLKPAAPVANQFKLKIDASVPAGIYEVRAAGRFGVSNPRLFAVGQFDELADDNTNSQIASPRELTIPVTVNAKMNANARDYFKVNLTQNQRILVECFAQRLDSRMDATLILYDANGKELTRNRDTIGTDPLIDFSAPAAGTYVIGVYDYLYRGSGEYFYRLSVHSAPFVDFVFPPAGKPGQSQYTIYGRNLPGGQADMTMAVGNTNLEKLVVQINLLGDPASRNKRGSGTPVALHTTTIDAFEYQLKTPQGSANTVTLGYATDAVIVEAEPNNSPDKATKVTIPCEVAGQFYPARDVDWIQFEAKKGDIYWVDVISHRMGLGTDPYFTIQRVTKNDKGEEQVADIANIDDPGDRNTRLGQDFDTSTDDPSYRFAVAQDATYRVGVKDQFNSSGADARRLYRLRIRKEQPSFRLIAMPVSNSPVPANQVLLISSVLRKGGNALLNVRTERRDGFDGELAITVEGLPAGVTSHGATLKGPQTTTTLVISAAENAAAWSGPIRVVGKAQIAGKEVAQTAWSGSSVWNVTNRQQDPPKFRATQQLMLAVMDKETEVAQVTSENKIWETSRGGKLEVPIKVARRGDFKADVTLVPLEATNDVKPPNLAIKAADAEGKLLIHIKNVKAPTGVYTFCLKSDVKFKYGRNQDAVKVAEAEQKRLDALVKEIQKKQTAANTLKTKKTQESQKADAALKAATLAKTTADNGAKAATAVAKTATDALTKAQAAATKDPENAGLKQAVVNTQKAKTDADAKQKAAVEKVTAADAALKQSTEKGKAATQAKTDAEKAFTDMDAKLKAVQAIKKTADGALTAVRNANKVADRTVSLYSSPIKVRIVETPIEVTFGAATPLKQGEKIEVPVTVARKYGFADQVQILFEGKISGLTAAKLTIPKDQTTGKLVLTAAKNAAVGDHSAIIRGRVNFNGVNNIDITQPLAFKIEEVKQ